jgi:hypothetical protein
LAKQLVNVVISIINEGGDFKSICLSGLIIAEDSIAKEQSRAIIASFGEAGKLLLEWMEVTLEMFPNCQDLVNKIPDPTNMSPTKLLGGMVSMDTCNTARLTRQTLCDPSFKRVETWDWMMKCFVFIKATVISICVTFLLRQVPITSCPS